MASETPFREVRRSLEKNGWSLIRISGSHHIFSGADRPLLSIPVHRGKVKAPYVRLVGRAIREIGGTP